MLPKNFTCRSSTPRIYPPSSRVEWWMRLLLAASRRPQRLLLVRALASQPEDSLQSAPIITLPSVPTFFSALGAFVAIATPGSWEARSPLHHQLLHECFLFVFLYFDRPTRRDFPTAARGTNAGTGMHLARKCPLWPQTRSSRFFSIILRRMFSFHVFIISS